MFSSGGYFRGLNCPFFLSGLCERPYCHFRHVKVEEEKTTARAGYSDSLPDKPSSHTLPGSSVHTYDDTRVISINKYTGKPEVLTKPEEYHVPHMQTEAPKGGAQNVNKYTGKPNNSTGPEEYLIEGSGYESYPGKTKFKPEEYQVPGSGYGQYGGIKKKFQQEEYSVEGSGYGKYSENSEASVVEEYSVEGSGYGKYNKNNIKTKVEEYQIEGSGYKQSDKAGGENRPEEYTVEGSGYGKYCSDNSKQQSKSDIQYNKYSGLPVNSKRKKLVTNHTEYQPPSSACPEYNPTPIDKLRTNQSECKITDDTPQSVNQEYDPLQNFSTGLGIHRPAPAKRTYSYDPTKPNFGCPPKKAKREDINRQNVSRFSDSEGEIGKFSEDEDEGDEEKERDYESEEEKPTLITDVKYFESLLMDSKDIKEDREKIVSKVELAGEELNKNNHALPQKNDKKAEIKDKTKLDGSHARDRTIFKALAKLSETMSKIKKSDLLCKDFKVKSSDESDVKISSCKSTSSQEKSSSSSEKLSSSSKHKSSDEKSSSKHKSSSSRHKSSHKSSSESSHRENCQNKTSTDSSVKKSSSKHSSSYSASHSSHHSKNHSNVSKTSNKGSRDSTSHCSDKKKSSDKHSRSSHKHSERKEHHSSSSDRKKDSVNDRHKKESSSSKSSEKDGNSGKERMKSADSTHGLKASVESQERRESTDSSKSRRSSVDKQKIVNLITNLFGEDSDNEGAVDEVGIMSEFSDDSDENEGDLAADDPYDECLKIFQEAGSSQPSPKKTFIKKFEKKQEENVIGKKRTAHKVDIEVKRKIPQKPLSKLSPAQVMHNRLLAMQKSALEAEEAKKKKEEQEKSASKSSIKSSSTTSDSSSKKRTAHSAFADACGTKVVDGKTVVSTTSKTAKRKAHTPNLPNLKRPTIPAEFGSKVPTNIRQRYLNTIIDECLKFCPEEEAFKRGQEEEANVYNRSNNKTIYLNVACNTIKRLRNEAAESLPSTSKKVTPMKMSHQAVLGGKNAVRNSYTLNRSGGSTKSVIQNFRGAELYKRLQKYILTEEQLKENGFPCVDPDDPSKVVLHKSSIAQQNSAKLKLHEKICSRCGKRFMVFPNGTYANKEECTYHWGKAWKKRIAGAIETRYTCCQGDLSSTGCQVAQYHAHETNRWENLTGYMRTIPCSPTLDGDYGVYAMDCEMVYTQAGIELARVTVTDQDNASVYETLVCPDRKVIDFNTRFSGIKEEDMHGVTTTIRDVQAVLLSLFTDKTILIGHSLESDLCAVKLIHNTVVDTSVVFPHRLGPPYKRALRNLIAEHLQRIIQDDVEGHDSQEDATSCMDLMHWRVKEDARKEARYN